MVRNIFTWDYMICIVGRSRVAPIITTDHVQITELCLNDEVLEQHLANERHCNLGILFRFEYLRHGIQRVTRVIDVVLARSFIKEIYKHESNTAGA